MKRWIWLVLVFIPAVLTASEKLEPLVGSPLYGQAMGLYQKGSYSKALKALKKAFLAEPQNWRIPQAMGDCYLHLKDPAKAAEAYGQSLALHPDNPALQRFLYGQEETTPAPTPAPSSRPIEFSLSIGPNFPFQNNSLTGGWNEGIQASFYLGVRPLPDWAFGIQADALGIVADNPTTLSSYTYPPYLASYSGPRLSVAGGNLALDAKYYFLPPTNPVGFYARGGPGLSLLYRSKGKVQVFDSNNSTTFDEYLPEIFRYAPSAQAGFGFTIKSEEAVRLFLECRATYGFFYNDPLFYGSVTGGLLIDL